MIRLFIFVLVLLAALVGVYAVVENTGGYVLLVAAGYTVEMSLLVAVALLLLLVGALYLTVSALRVSLRTRRQFAGWASDRRRQRGINRTTQGLVAFIEGRWDYARKSLAKAAANSSTPLVNYLFAARASSQLGDDKAVDGFLKQAELSTEGAGVAIGLTQAELQIQNRQFEQALATLLRVKRQTAQHPIALKLLAQVYIELNDWPSLLKLVPVLRHYATSASAVPEQRVIEFERLACNGLLHQAAGAGNADALTECWRSLPSSCRKAPAIVGQYAGLLNQRGQSEMAENLLRAQLQRNYDASLLDLYSKLPTTNTEKQLAFVEKLLKVHATDPHMYLALARIARRMQQADRAEECYQKSIALQPMPVALTELAELYAAQCRFEQSVALYARSNASDFRGQAGKPPAVPAPASIRH